MLTLQIEPHQMKEIPRQEAHSGPFQLQRLLKLSHAIHVEEAKQCDLLHP